MKNKGITLVEVIVVIAIFSLFLLAFHATLYAGLKNWKMGETRSDIQGRAEVVMKRIINELQLSSAIGVQIDTGGNNMDMGDSVTRTVHEYVCFETPVKNGRVMYDSKKMGNPLWQGYVIYYVEPQNVNNASMTKKIYRKYVPHNLPSEPDPGWDGKTTAVPMPFVTLSGKLNTSVTGDEILRPICENLSYADFTIDGCIVNIELGFEKILRENSGVAFSPGGEGIEKFAIKCAVEPKN